MKALGLIDAQRLRQIAELLEERPIALSDAMAKEMCATLRRIAGGQEREEIPS